MQGLGLAGKQGWVERPGGGGDRPGCKNEVFKRLPPPLALCRCRSRTQEIERERPTRWFGRVLQVSGRRGSGNALVCRRRRRRALTTMNMPPDRSMAHKGQVVGRRLQGPGPPRHGAERGSLSLLQANKSGQAHELRGTWCLALSWGFQGMYDTRLGTVPTLSATRDQQLSSLFQSARRPRIVRQVLLFRVYATVGRQRKSAVPGLWGICEVFEFMYRRYRVYFASGTCTVAFGDGKKNQGILGNRLNGRAEAATKNPKKIRYRGSTVRYRGSVVWP